MDMRGTMFLVVVQAKYLKGYCIAVTFNDGTSKVVDLSDEVRKYPVFRPLQDKKKFADFTLTDTLEWADGTIDIAPEYLYDKA